MERLDLREMPDRPDIEAAIHCARYAIAKGLVAGKRVLDVACGEGYGSYLSNGVKIALRFQGLNFWWQALKHYLSFLKQVSSMLSCRLKRLNTYRIRSICFVV
jgi:ubiquinone/menaquinone biosynthesis C-methylase UbiE